MPRLEGKKFKKRYLLFFGIVLLIIYFGPQVAGGYSYSASLAIQHSLPNQDGEVVFEKDFGNKKVVIVDTAIGSFVKLIDKKFGIFYRASSVELIEGKTPQGKMKITWSASQKNDQQYDSLFAAEILDDDIVKVIVTNESQQETIKSLLEARKESSIFIEMKVKNGYAAHYSQLNNSDAGNFVFRGINAEGDVISIDD